MLSSAGLTKREHSVATLVCDGLSNKLIAQQLGIAEGTVKMHVKHILRKFGVRGRGALILQFNDGPFLQPLAAD